MLDERKEMTTEWFHAAENGRVDVLDRLIARGVLIETRDECRRTALMLATKGRRLEAVRFLLARQANPNVQDLLGWTALTYAVNRTSANFCFNSPETPMVGPSHVILDLLQSAGGKIELREAVLSGNVQLINKLCNAGADPSGDAKWHYHDTYLMVATDVGLVDVVEALLDLGADVEGQDDLGDTALMRAVTTGRIDLMRLLIERGADIDQPNWSQVTPLGLAAAISQKDLVEFLIQKGSRRDLLDAIALNDLPLVRFLLENPRIRNGIVDFPDRNDYSIFGRPAMFTARLGNLEILKLLLKHGADINAIGYDKHSILARAAFYGQLDMVRFLLESGADPNAVGIDRKSSLDWAVQGGHVEVIRTLLK